MSNYHIPDPCHENWEEMTPAERGRHCAVCDKVVMDLTSMGQQEIQQTLDAARDRSGARPGESIGVCAHTHVRPMRRRQGHVLTSGMALLLAFGATGQGEACEAAPEADPRPVKGKIAVHEVPAQEVPAEIAELGEIVIAEGDVVVAPDPQPKPEGDPEVQVEVLPEQRPIRGRIRVLPDPQPQVQPDPRVERGDVVVAPLQREPGEQPLLGSVVAGPIKAGEVVVLEEVVEEPAGEPVVEVLTPVDDTK